MPLAPSGTGSSSRMSTPNAARSAAVAALLVVVVAVLQLFTNTGETTLALHLFYRRLYYVPIVYSAFVFGRRGGLLAALVASLPYALHAAYNADGFFGHGIDNALEIGMFFFAGIVFGYLRDLERNRNSDLEQVSLRLEDAYRTLEERAIQLINIQDYTQSILRSITSGVLTVGPDGSVATANPSAERMLGMSEYDMVPKAIGSLFRDDAGISVDVEKVLSGRLPLTLRDVSVVVLGGRTLHLQVSTSRMRTVGGRVLGAVVTLEDVSDIRALTDQLIRADRLAAMGELTAGVAHEVRNPLGIIRASVQLLEDAECDASRITEAAEIIKHEIDRLDKVIKALLDFGRPSKPSLVRFDLEGVLEDVILFTERFAGQSEVEIVPRFSGGLPQVQGDPDQLKQVFLNLVTNAVQAMDEAGSGGTIVLATGIEADFVQVSVADTGPGIPAENISKVFDPFFSTRDAGTGLGLTIVHRIIDEHDGHIEVESTREGTVFKVSLPAVME